MPLPNPQIIAQNCDQLEKLSDEHIIMLALSEIIEALDGHSLFVPSGKRIALASDLKRRTGVLPDHGLHRKPRGDSPIPGP